MALIVPSILSADFAHLGEQVEAAQLGGADRLQIDVMDGRFVPNITVGPLIVEAVRQHTTLPLEAHLMIVEPERYIEDFAKAGADLIIVHQEVSPHLHRTIQHIHRLGKRAGVAINPATPLTVLQEILNDVDLTLCMTVNPGFGGQDFIPSMLPKIERLRAMIEQHGAHCDLEVDGGISAVTAPQAVRAGANVLVAGSAVYNDSAGVSAAIARIRAALG
ncbi:MAG: Ribulose-phosphate 3-epimerase [Ktedonobacterales bacterium]|jgi:ribulose-phosphate 3-epimerase|nr:MAG: Ribulose-phosphate 3-epimerase [Ktedonobacterales bacterium]